MFHPTEEEFKDFYAYAQKLDKLVGHVGVCKVVPPKGWKARPHDLYNLQDSAKQLEDAVQVKRPIKQNAIGGKGLYANVHEVKRSMTLADFKKAATNKEFSPPVETQFRELSDEDVDLLERRFWRNVLFNPPLYGADCPAPTGLRSDGGEGLFDPLTCGDWDLAKLPSLLTHGIKKRVPGVNTPYLYVGMYRAAFAWHCEDMDLHSINYLHWGAPKTWYTVPATHGRKLEELACKNFPVQAGECKEFLRHKSVMMEPSILLKANIPLTRTVQRPGEFIINFPGAYHSGFNNGYNCAESCNFATEYWIPFGVQAKPCSCDGGKDSVHINIGSIIKKIGVNNVKVKGEQWVQCDECDKWRLLPPYLMNLVRDEADELSCFSCKMIEGMTCSTKQSAAATAEDGEAWEIDGKVQIGLNPDLEQWVMCEQCSKWRRLPPGHALDADASFLCNMLPQVTCQDAEEKADDDGDDRAWQLMDVSTKKTKFSAWTKEDEKRQQLAVIKDEINGYCIADAVIADAVVPDSVNEKEELEALLKEVKGKWSSRWESAHERWQKLGGVAGSKVGSSGEASKGVSARQEAAAQAKCVAQKLWLLSLEAEDDSNSLRRSRDAEKRRRKIELALVEDAQQAAVFGAALAKAMDKALPAARVAAVKPEFDPSGDVANGQIKSEDTTQYLEEWRYAEVGVTVLALGVDSPVPVRGVDEKTWSAVLRVLSPIAKDVRTLRVPRADHTSSSTLQSSDAQLVASLAGSCAKGGTSMHSPMEPQQQHPAEAGGASMSQSTLAAAATVAAVSAGWKEYTTPDGQKYYHHAVSQTTQWTAPPGWGQAASFLLRPLHFDTQNFDTLLMRPMIQSSKEGAVIDKMLELLAPHEQAPCSVLLRNVKVVVGYWHRDGIESKPRLDALLATEAKKVVLDNLVGFLKQHLTSLITAASQSTTMGAANAAAGASLHTDLSVTLKVLQGQEGAMRVEDFVTRGLLRRAAAEPRIQLVGMASNDNLEQYLVVEMPELLADIARAQQEKAVKDREHNEWVLQHQRQQQQSQEQQQHAQKQQQSQQQSQFAQQQRIQQLQQLLLFQQQLQQAQAQAPMQMQSQSQQTWQQMQFPQWSDIVANLALGAASGSPHL